MDHNLLTMLAKNVDALRLSTYMSKDRNEKLKMGPIWDFDRSMDSTDGRDDAYDTWYGTSDATQYFNYDWWGRLFLDADFRLNYAGPVVSAERRSVQYQPYANADRFPGGSDS